MRYNFILIICLILLSEVVPVTEADAQPTKALYGFSSGNAPFDEMDTEAIPAWLKEHGLNAVFVSSSEKTEVLKTLKSAGLKCYQEIAIFTGRSLYNEHPEWRPIGKDGEALKPDGWYHGLSPNQPALRQYRLDQFEKYLQKPNIDGLWLDFIRYPVRWEGKSPRIEQSCFSDAALNQFEEQMNINLPDDKTTAQTAELILTQYPDEWTRFKINTINAWVKEAKQLRDKHRPDLTLGLFGVPWLEDDFDNAIKRIVAQDFEALSAHVDVFSPMVYIKLCHGDVPWIANVTTAFKSMTNKPVWPIVQAVNDPTTLTANEFKQSIHTSLHSGEGVIIFHAGHVEAESRWGQLKTALTEKK